MNISILRNGVLVELMYLGAVYSKDGLNVSFKHGIVHTGVSEEEAERQAQPYNVRDRTSGQV